MRARSERRDRPTLAGSPVEAPRVALVTGGSRGIGRAIALSFARAGYDVAFSYRRDADAADRVGREIGALGRTAHYRLSDANDAEDAARFVGEARSALGRLDVVVPNAGATGAVGWESKSVDEWHELLATLLIGPYATLRAAAPELRRTHGCAVLIASIAGLTAYPEEVAYAAAKAGTLSLTRSLALALAPEVRVNAVAPGWVRTDMTRMLYEATTARDAIAHRIPRGRWGEPEDVAHAVLFLASEGARFITGETLVVDGGELLSWRAGRASRGGQA